MMREGSKTTITTTNGQLNHSVDMAEIPEDETREVNKAALV